MRRGFTLVELMVVVAILGLLMLVLSVTLSRTLDSASVEVAELQELRQAALTAIPTEDGRAPVATTSDIDVRIATTPVLDGLTVRTRLETRFDGTFGFRNPDAGMITLRFPFPPDVERVQNARLTLQRGEGPPIEPAAVTYDLTGIRWRGLLSANEAITARVVYTAQGQDAFSYDLVGAGRSGDIHVRLTLPDGPTWTLPDASIPPTSESATELEWSLTGLITDAPVSVSFSAAASPLGRLILLLRLAGLGVLLFAAGLWYLSEEVRPGSLDDFHIGGLLLLALNYSLFFGIAAVLGYRGSQAVALVVAAAVSLPLITLHVARILGVPFAIRRALPLAVTTLGVVVGLVWLPEQRALIGLGALIGAVAYVTVTWRAWQAGRATREASAREEWIRTRRQTELTAAREALRGALYPPEGSRLAATRALDEAPVGLAAERAEIKRGLERLERSVARGTEILAESAPTQEDECRQQQVAAKRLAEQLSGQSQGLDAAVAALETAGARATEALVAALRRLEQGLDASTLAEVAARALLSEAPLRLRGEVQGRLERIEALRVESEGLRAGIGAPGLDVRSATATAMRLATGVRETTEALAAASRRLDEAIRHLLVQTATEETGPAALHCPACGGAHPRSSRFCPQCGTLRPRELSCGACGQVTRLPTHLLITDWERAGVHCGGCGTVCVAPEPDAAPEPSSGTHPASG